MDVVTIISILIPSLSGTALMVAMAIVTVAKVKKAFEKSDLENAELKKKLAQTIEFNRTIANQNNFLKDKLDNLQTNITGLLNYMVDHDYSEEINKILADVSEQKAKTEEQLQTVKKQITTLLRGK